MVRFTPLAALLPIAAAYPAAMQMDQSMKRAAAPKTDGRLNTGLLHPDPTFDAEAQFVDVRPGSGHEWQSPQCPQDHRGQCPGLNAAANHGFLPRNGLPTLQQTIDGLGAAYNMGPDLAGVLAAVSILGSGDIPTLTWSIGGEFPASLPGLSNPSGILGTHDRYEGDASITRGDAYLNGGNVDAFKFRSWEHLYSIIGDNLSLAKVSYHDNYVTEYSVTHNPYYFSGPFSGLVAPAAHNFLPAFMSNHTAENPGGYLDEFILKEFFAITGEPGSFVWHQYQERIPLNWYKRPGGPTGDYNNADVFADLIGDAALYPNILRVGGNTGTVNSFVGVDLGNLTGGAYNADTLLQGDNLQCFFLQAASQTQVDELNGVVGSLSAALAPITSALAGLDCPQLHDFEFQTFEIFPGFKYQPASPPSCPPMVTYENGNHGNHTHDNGTYPTATTTWTKSETSPTSSWTGTPKYTTA